jgi:hypothetical protein
MPLTTRRIWSGTNRAWRKKWCTGDVEGQASLILFVCVVSIFISFYCTTYHQKLFYISLHDMYICIYTYVYIQYVHETRHSTILGLCRSSFICKHYTSGEKRDIHKGVSHHTNISITSPYDNIKHITNEVPSRGVLR